MKRLPDFDLEVLVEHAAEGVWNAQAAIHGGPVYADAPKAHRNVCKEAALPFIFHGTKALEELGYRKHRTVTTVEELDALPVGSVILDPKGLSLHKNAFTGWYASNGAKNITAEVLALEALPATVLHEPGVAA